MLFTPPPNMSFTKTTPRKAEMPFSNFTEHSICEYKFGLEQSEKAKVYLLLDLHYSDFCCLDQAITHTFKYKGYFHICFLAL